MVLHRGVEILLKLLGQPVDLINEEHLVPLEARQRAGQVFRGPERGAGRHDNVGLHALCDEVGERRLSEAGWAAQQHVIERLGAPGRGLDGDAQVVPDLLLPDELGEGARAEAAVELLFVGVGRCVEDHRLGHRTCVGGWIHHAAGVTEELPIYELLGAAKLEAIVAAFYRRIPQDDVLGPMYPPGDLEGAERRLSSFLLFRFGGPQTYLAERGHPRLRMRHRGVSIDTPFAEAWLRCMTAAMNEEQIEGRVREFLDARFAEVAMFLRNRPDS